MNQGQIEQRYGRATFANTLKDVFMPTSANFGNMFSMAGASLFLTFLPMLPSQIYLVPIDYPFRGQSNKFHCVIRVNDFWLSSWNISAARNNDFILNKMERQDQNVPA
jgi:Mg2+-importing ATPase